MLQSIETKPGQHDGVAPKELVELMAAFHDVTERLDATHAALRAEVSHLRSELADANEQLARAQRLAALGEMAAGIAHEVRNPLASIGLYASLLRDDLGEHPELIQTLDRISGAVHHVNAVVTDVLRFAREMRIRLSRCNASDLLQRATHACAAELEGTDVELSASTDIAIECDGMLVQQALINLIRNACEAMQEQQAPRRINLGVQERSITDSRGRQQRMVALIVRDTGPGIDEDVCARMFNPFFTTRHTGTGLGLAIVHRIVDAHAGRITVEQPDDGGTHIELLLPQQDVQELEDAA